MLTIREKVYDWLHMLHTMVQDICSPAYCAYCWALLTVRTPLCHACASLMRSIVSYDLVISEKRSCTVYALSAYEDPLKSLILAKQSRSIISAYQLGQIMAERLTLPAITAADVLVPIPLHWQRYAWRGFNQAEIIAQSIAHKHGASVVPLLTRVKQTAYQAEARSRDSRQANVTAAFLWNKKYHPHDYNHKRLILVDDLMTTGATLRSAVDALDRAYKQCNLTPSMIQASVAARVIAR
jgi:ComF family protein